jgi:hypothetical protein
MLYCCFAIISSGVTIEYQRARAKEMLKYFKEKKQDEVARKAQ